MEGKPLHYDGSIQKVVEANDASTSESFKLTDEMRANISANPYLVDKSE